MKIFVAWDDLEQIDLMTLYLSNEDNELFTTTDAEEGYSTFSGQGGWDVAVISVRLPDIDSGYNLFRRIRTLRPEVPVICGCNSEDIYRLARFMVGGMKSYLLRDKNGDFLFLLSAMLESVVEWVRAEREQTIAGKLREEVESVRKIQETIIPKDVVPPKGYRVVACYEPSQVRVIGGQPVTMAGGDYYDFFTLPDDRCGILIADVSGHGTPAAVVMAVLHSLAHMYPGDPMNPSLLLNHLNHHLTTRYTSESGHFVTAFYGIYDDRTRELTFSSAGHNPPRLRHCGHQDVTALNHATSMPLGFMPDVTYQNHTIVLRPGDRIVFYTDGITEAANPGGELFGTDRLDQIVGCCHRDTQGSLDQVVTAVNEFTHHVPPSDDRTLVIADVT